MMKGVKAILGILLICISYLRTDAQVISPLLFGQNAWMPDTIGNAQSCQLPPCILYGQLHNKWSSIQLSNASIIRFGGIAPDKNTPTNYQYIKMIDSIRAHGMEPVMQVPFHNYLYNAQQAAAIVQYVNITRSRNVKYWIIGNEPDYEYSYTTAAQVAAYFKPFASAMKAVDPGIVTIGPECAWYDANIIDGLTTPNGPNDITGTDANGRYYCDIISFHYYAFNGSQTRAQVLTTINQAGGLNANLVTLNSRLANCNVAHNRTGNNALQCAITEANVNFQNPAGDNVNGIGAMSFLGGQFIAETYAAGMKNSVKFINIWSVIEGNNNSMNVGYLDYANGNKKSSFWHFKLMAEHMKGNNLAGTSNQANVKIFGSQDAQSICAMILNEDLTNNYNFTLRLNNGVVSGNNALKMNIASNLAVEYNDVINNQTSILLQFNLQGNLIKKCVYSLANHAAFNLPPTCETYGLLPVGLTNFQATSQADNTVLLSWATASEKNNAYFMVQRSTDGVNFDDIGKVNGAGTSQQNHYYQFRDASPIMGLSFYRLKQVDDEGSFTYSDLRMMVMNNYSEVNVFPNPGDGSVVHMELHGLPAQGLVFQLFDAQGKEIGGRLEQSSADKYDFYPHHDLSKGIYILHIDNGDKSFRKKLVVK